MRIGRSDWHARVEAVVEIVAPGAEASLDSRMAHSAAKAMPDSCSVMWSWLSSSALAGLIC